MTTTSRHIPFPLLAALGLVALGGPACSQHTRTGQGDSGLSESGGASAGGAGTELEPQLQDPLPATQSNEAAQPSAVADGVAGGSTADGSAGSAGDAAPNPAAIGREQDITPPSIVSVSPAPGALGVPANARIRIEFSEPMNRRATREAFASDSLPPNALMSWNKAGTVLTIAPRTALEYAHSSLVGAQPLELGAKTYAYTLGHLACDLAGNPLPETRLQFSTLRAVTHTLAAVPALTGVVPSAVEGETPYYGFVTLDVGQLPTGILDIQNVIARANPYVVPASLPLFDVVFHTLDGAAITAGPGTLITTLPSGLSGDQWVPDAIWRFLEADYRERGETYHYSQLRLPLPEGTAEETARAASALLQSFSLELNYVLP